jgi:hypothetical protein
VFPVGAAVIAYAFCFSLVRQFARRPRPYLLVWAAALLMFALASQFMAYGVIGGWSSLDFRMYWLFGAILNVPYLLQGEVYLLARRKAWAHALMVVLALATVFAAWKVWAAPIRRAALATALPLGKDVFGAGTLPHRLAQYYALPAYFLLLGGLVWSGWQMKGRPDLRGRTAGTLGIAIGATVVAVGSGIGAAFDVVPLFSVSLAVGVAVMFAGFVRASRPQSAPSRPAQAPPPSV